jgi:hypothetical protein
MIGGIAGVIAQQSTEPGITWWQELLIVIVGTLIAGAIALAFSALGKHSHRVHVAEKRLTLANEWDVVDESGRKVLRLRLVVVNTSDLSLLVGLERMDVELDDEPLGAVPDLGDRYELSPGQRQPLVSEVPLDHALSLRGIFERATVASKIDYGRRSMWWLRRSITATIEGETSLSYRMTPLGGIGEGLGADYVTVPSDRFSFRTRQASQ